MSSPHSLRQSLLEKIARFPASPGVYLMKDQRNRILYIGKAVHLRSRVRSYFSAVQDRRVLVEHLVRRVVDVDCLVTASEAEALILENNLIKKNRPIFNVRLRDDKSYLCLKVTVEEKWPRVLTTRRYRNDGNLYFGPFGSASSVREMLKIIKKFFQLRTCTNGFFKTRKRPCIEYDIGCCSAPCIEGYVTHERYMDHVQEVLLFLRGKNSELLEILQEKMRRAATEHHFELAARYRDQIRAIERIFEVQKAQGLGGGDLDVFAHVREGDSVGIQEIIIREGRMLHSKCHTFRSALPIEEIISSFLSQFYLQERQIPPTILCDVDFPDREVLRGWLRERREAAVRIAIPLRGEKRRLVDMARENARNSFTVGQSQKKRLETTLDALRRALSLADRPRRIECFDISNFQGSATVGAMVVFEDGEPEKGQYRKFRVRSVQGTDDFASMREVLQRRFRDSPDTPGSSPDLLVIDGGKGQLGVATAVLRDCGLEDVAVLGLAKQRRPRGTTERIFVPGRSSPLPIAQDDPISLFLQRVRDEAHRFAIRYHRQLRRKASMRTGLEGVPGIGKRRGESLLARFGSLDGVRKAGEKDLTEVLGAKLAESVWRHFQA